MVAPRAVPLASALAPEPSPGGVTAAHAPAAVAEPAVYEPPLRPELICQTERYKRLQCLDAYYDGTQYDGRPDWWTGGDSKKPVPLRERAPCVVYPLPKACVNQATRFTFGESRFPTIQVHEIEAADAIAPGLAVTKDEAEILNKGIAGLITQAKLRAGMRTLERRGLSACTAVAVIAIRKGRFEVDKPRARDCIPTFKAGSTTELAALTVCYQFQKLVPNEKTGAPEYKAHWYRRDITESEYVVFEDAFIEPGSVKPIAWTRDEAASKPHGLGFCPAIWIRNLGDGYDGDPDGCSLYEGLEDEFDALNFALSQRHRGIHYWGTPQPYATNLGEDTEVAPAARTARTMKAPKNADGSDDLSGIGSTAPARKIGPDNMMLYKGDVEVGVFETTGAAFDSATKHVLDIRARVLEAIDVVLLDPTTVAGKGDISAKALSFLYAPLLGLVDELRECWWSEGLEAILAMMLRMIAALGGKGIYLARIGKLASILKRFLITVEGAPIWMPPTMTPVWGDYFSPSNAEIKVAVDTAIEASGTVVSKETSARYVAPYFGVTDVEQELEDLEKDSLEAAQKALDIACGGGADGPGKPGATSPDAKGGKTGDTMASSGGPPDSEEKEPEQ